MSGYLLDTHLLGWTIAHPERLSAAALKAIENDPLLVSVASLWEMVNKKGRATAPVAEPRAWWHQHAIRREIPALAIRFDHVAQLEAMHWEHQDPYDRTWLHRPLSKAPYW